MDFLFVRMPGMVGQLKTSITYQQAGSKDQISIPLNQAVEQWRQHKKIFVDFDSMPPEFVLPGLWSLCWKLTAIRKFQNTLSTGRTPRRT